VGPVRRLTIRAGGTGDVATQDREQNEAFFDTVEPGRAAIEQEFGE
jgi:hypothetical protein